MGKLNYTYYNRLKDLLLDRKILISKIKKDLDDSYSFNSMWEMPSARKEYIEILKRILSRYSFVSYYRLKKEYKKVKKEFDKKIRVVFFCYEYQTFPTFKSVYDLMKNSDDFICDLVHVPFYHTDKKYDGKKELCDYKINNYSEVIEYDEYDLSSCSPDVAFFLKPYDLIPKQYYIDEIEKVVETIIYIPYGMEIGATKESMRYQFQLPLHDKATMCISYCSKHYERAKKYSKSKGKNFYYIGHTRMDLVNEDFSSEKDYASIVKKAHGRKIFLWNPHFTIGDGDNWGSFKLYGLDILKCFSNHKELFLLYRPHPFLEMAIENEYKDNKEVINEYNSLLRNNKDNIYVDHSGNYLISMQVSDVLISDANSFVPEYLIHNKPVIYTKKIGTTGFKNKELEKMLYICKSKEDIIKYINLLNSDNDLKASTRVKDIKRVFKYNKNKSVSKQIIQLIKERYN